MLQAKRGETSRQNNKKDKQTSTQASKTESKTRGIETSIATIEYDKRAEVINSNY